MLRFVIILITVAWNPAWAQWTTNLYGPHEFVALSETNLVPESSGVIASRTSPDVFWTHNDSGHPHPRVWAFRLSTKDKTKRKVKHLGYVELHGASNVDWEDIAAGPNHRIYVLDGGDNPPCKRTNKHIHRFIESVVEPHSSTMAITVSFESLLFEYPDTKDPAHPAQDNGQRYDAECLFVHPANGDMYIVTKRDGLGKAVARVYKLLAADINWNSQRRHVLTFVADLSSPILNMVTGGDISPDGRRIVLRNYLAAFEYTLPAGQPFEMIFRQRPQIHSLAREAVQLLQGEGICYTHDSRDLITTTESRKGSTDRQFRIFQLPWQLANLRVESVVGESAIVRWDTAQPLDSIVEYGHRTDDAQAISDQTEVTSHAVKLANLKPGTRYHYRVQSGPLRYPSTMPASDVSFMSAPTQSE